VIFLTCFKLWKFSYCVILFEHVSHLTLHILSIHTYTFSLIVASMLTGMHFM
jgi:hypothetical protein